MSPKCPNSIQCLVLMVYPLVVGHYPVSALSTVSAVSPVSGISAVSTMYQMSAEPSVSTESHVF